MAKYIFKVAQTVGKGESICPTCIHHKVCRYTDNQPCLRCNQYEKEKQGIWTDYNNKGSGILGCSECLDVFIFEEWLKDEKWHYCPNCGAKMEIEK